MEKKREKPAKRIINAKFRKVVAALHLPAEARYFFDCVGFKYKRRSHYLQNQSWGCIALTRILDVGACGFSDYGRAVQCKDLALGRWLI